MTYRLAANAPPPPIRAPITIPTNNQVLFIVRECTSYARGAAGEPLGLTEATRPAAMAASEHQRRLTPSPERDGRVDVRKAWARGECKGGQAPEPNPTTISDGGQIRGHEREGMATSGEKGWPPVARARRDASRVGADLLGLDLGDPKAPYDGGKFLMHIRHGDLGVFAVDQTPGALPLRGSARSGDHGRAPWRYVADRARRRFDPHEGRRCPVS